jgi:hypothetical protein
MDQKLGLDFKSMKNVDIRTVDPATLVDILEIKVDSAMTQPERMLDFIRQIKNPYCFRCGKFVVKVSHADTDVTLEQRLDGI